MKQLCLTEEKMQAKIAELISRDATNSEDRRELARWAYAEAQKDIENLWAEVDSLVAKVQEGSKDQIRVVRHKYGKFQVASFTGNSYADVTTSLEGILSYLKKKLQPPKPKPTYKKAKEAADRMYNSLNYSDLTGDRILLKDFFVKEEEEG